DDASDQKKEIIMDAAPSVRGHAGFLSPRRAAARQGLPKMTISCTLETSASRLWMRKRGVELCLPKGHSSTPGRQGGAGNAVRRTRRGKSVAQIAAVTDTLRADWFSNPSWPGAHSMESW